MDLDEQPQLSSLASDVAHHQVQENKLDLVGGPFAVVESDPGVFTSLTRKLGIRGIELVEMYDIEPWAVDHLNPHGLIFCFLWRKDAHRPADFGDPAAERVWFANQLTNDACASHAILNVLLNCPRVDIGDELRRFKQDTERLSPVMKGLAFTNLPLLRLAHNSLSRPADIRGALNSIAITTLDEAKAKAKVKQPPTAPKHGTKRPPKKRTKMTKLGSVSLSKPTEATPDTDEPEEAFHFIGYVPAYGKVWELDGLKSGPLEVGEYGLCPTGDCASSSSSARNSSKRNSSDGWMDVVRPALRMKMEKYGGAAEGGSNIRFSLLAIVDGLYEQAGDQLKLLRKEGIALQNRIGEGWEKKVDPDLFKATQHAFAMPPIQTSYAVDFGAQQLSMGLRVINMLEEELVPAWETCARKILQSSVAVEDELSKAIRANTDHIKRTFDYEPFLKAFIESLQTEGHLKALLDGSGGSTKPANKRRALS